MNQRRSLKKRCSRRLYVNSPLLQYHKWGVFKTILKQRKHFFRINLTDILNVSFPFSLNFLLIPWCTLYSSSHIFGKGVLSYLLRLKQNVCIIEYQKCEERETPFKWRAVFLNDFSWICIEVIIFLSLLSTKTERALIGFPFARKIINYTLWEAWGEKTGYSEQEAIIAINDIYIGREAKIRPGFVSISVCVVCHIAYYFVLFYFVLIWKWKIEFTFS